MRFCESVFVVRDNRLRMVLYLVLRPPASKLYIILRKYLKLFPTALCRPPCRHACINSAHGERAPLFSRSVADHDVI